MSFGSDTCSTLRQGYPSNQLQTNRLRDSFKKDDDKIRVPMASLDAFGIEWSQRRATSKGKIYVGCR